MNLSNLARSGRDVVALQMAIKKDSSFVSKLSPEDFIGVMRMINPAQRGNYLAKLFKHYWCPDFQPLSNRDERGDFLDTKSGAGYEFKVSVVDWNNPIAHFNQVRPHLDSKFLLCVAFDIKETETFYPFLLNKEEVLKEDRIFGSSTHGKNGKERSFRLRWNDHSEDLNRWLEYYLEEPVTVSDVLAATKARRFEA